MPVMSGIPLARACFLVVDEQIRMAGDIVFFGGV